MRKTGAGGEGPCYGDDGGAPSRPVFRRIEAFPSEGVRDEVARLRLVVIGAAGADSGTGKGRDDLACCGFVGSGSPAATS